MKRKRSPNSPKLEQRPAITHKVPQEMAYSVKIQFLKCNSLFLILSLELVEDLNYERRRLAREHR